MAKKTDLPKQVYVVREEDDDSSFLLAYEDFKSIDNGSLVGVYQLQELKHVSVTTELV